LQRGPAPYAGTSLKAGAMTSPKMACSAARSPDVRLSGVLSVSDPGGHGPACHHRPVAYLFPRFTRTPSEPLSMAVPPRALSNLWIGKTERTPMAWSSSSPASMSASVHWGTSFWRPQSSTSDTSAPRTTASFPSLITRRASAGERTTRKKPLPGPRYWASM
jgi:hypothetical protein